MDETKERQALARGARAKALLEAEEYTEAWDIYRQRIFDAFEAAKSDDVDTIMQLKRLLASATAARAHMQALVIDGQVAGKTLELLEKKPLLKRVFG